MTNIQSRLATTPEPWPTEPNADGSLPGNLPLTMPKKTKDSPTVVITARDTAKRETLYEVRKRGGQEVIRCKIDTVIEWILNGGVTALFSTQDGVYRVRVGNQPLARIIAGQNPSRHANRIYVDHADRNTTNDTLANLHWVSTAFNSFNRQRRGSASGYIGVNWNTSKYYTTFRGVNHGGYKNPKTAARVYDLVCTIAFGDQLLKTPHLLNNLDQDQHVFEIESKTDCVNIIKVDDIHVVIYEGKVEETHKKVEDAKEVAGKLIEKLKAARVLKAQQWTEKAESLTIQRNAQGIAFIPLKTKATDTEPSQVVEILLDDKDWIDLHARTSSFFLSWNKRATCCIGGSSVMVSRWLCNPRAIDIVDHISGNVYDHRRPNLAIRDRSANSQNYRKSNGLVGVCLRGSRWIARITVKDQGRRAWKACNSLDEAVELYDLAAIYQQGAHALINFPEKLAEYLDKLTDEEAQTQMKDFLNPSSKTKTSMLFGVELKQSRYVPTLNVGKKRSGQPKSFRRTEKGAEVKAAVTFDIWKLKPIAPDLVINFNQLRPCYQHWLTELTKENQSSFIEKAYELLGGDAFDPDRDESPPPETSSTSASGSAIDPVEVCDSPPDTAASTSASGSATNPIVIPEALSSAPLLGKRKSQG